MDYHLILSTTMYIIKIPYERKKQTAIEINNIDNCE